MDHHGGTRIFDRALHIDDPRLRMSADVREEGAWDFTDSDKLDMDWRDETENRLKLLENAVIVTPTDGYSRELLRTIAKKSGVVGYSKMSSDELRQRLLEARLIEEKPPDEKKPGKELVEA